MQPMMIVPPKTFSADDLKLLRDNGICVVEAEEPSKVKFFDPIPATSNRTQIEDAAIKLSRTILNKGYWTHDSTRQTVAALFFDILSKGSPLDPNPMPTQAEVLKEIFDEEKADEMRKLAREEARAERAAEKAAKAAKAEKK